MMPEMDGFDSVVEFHRCGASRAIAIVVITARDLSRQDRERLNDHVQTAGCDDFDTKPVDPADSRGDP